MFEFSDAFQCRRGQGASLQQVGVTNPGYYGLIKALLNIPQSQFSVKYTNTAFIRCCSYYQLFISASTLTSVKYVTRTKMSYSVEFDRNATLYSFSQLQYEAYLPIYNQIFCLSDSVNIHTCNGPQTWMITDFLECITSSFWSRFTLIKITKQILFSLRFWPWLKINKAEIIPFLSYEPSNSSEPTDSCWHWRKWKKRKEGRW